MVLLIKSLIEKDRGVPEALENLNDFNFEINKAIF